MRVMPKNKKEDSKKICKSRLYWQIAVVRAIYKATNWSNAEIVLKLLKSNNLYSTRNKNFMAKVVEYEDKPFIPSGSRNQIPPSMDGGATKKPIKRWKIIIKDDKTGHDYGVVTHNRVWIRCERNMMAFVKVGKNRAKELKWMVDQVLDGNGCWGDSDEINRVKNINDKNKCTIAEQKRISRLNKAYKVLTADQYKELIEGGKEI